MLLCKNNAEACSAAPFPIYSIFAVGKGPTQHGARIGAFVVRRWRPMVPRRDARCLKARKKR